MTNDRPFRMPDSYYDPPEGPHCPLCGGCTTCGDLPECDDFECNGDHCCDPDDHRLCQPHAKEMKESLDPRV